MINYSQDIDHIQSEQLNGFFVGWPNPPSEKVLLELLKNSYKKIVAIEDTKVIGFITAISDGVLSAYIPFLEVLPEFQSQGIGKELMKRMHNELSDLYMVDLLCDKELIPYYEKLGMSPASGAYIRNYHNQSGV